MSLTEYQLNCALASWWRSEASKPHRRKLFAMYKVFAGETPQTWQPPSSTLVYAYRKSRRSQYKASMEQGIVDYRKKLSMDSARL